MCSLHPVVNSQVLYYVYCKGRMSARGNGWMSILILIDVDIDVMHAGRGIAIKTWAFPLCQRSESR